MSTSHTKTLNRILWTAQSIIALLFLFAGSMKFIIPAEQMQQGPINLPIAFMHFIGACECLGALGLILPSVLRIRTWLTPLAAAGLTSSLGKDAGSSYSRVAPPAAQRLRPAPRTTAG